MSRKRMTKEEYKRIVERRTDELYSEFGEKEIKLLVEEHFLITAKDMLCSILGLEERWGRWEVKDTDNIIMKELEKALQSVVLPTFQEVIKDVTLTKKQILSIKKAYRDRLEDQIRELAYTKAEEDAKNIIEEFFAKENNNEETPDEA